MNDFKQEIKMLNKIYMVNVKSYLVPLVLYFVFGCGCSEKTSKDTTVKRPDKKIGEAAKTNQAEDQKEKKKSTAKYAT